MPSFFRLSRITWLELMVHIELSLSAVIVIFTVIGVAIGHQVAMLFLLALLQVAITLPGCVYATQRSGFFLLVYIGAQLCTGVCELVWLLVHVLDGGDWPPAVALGILVALQFFSFGVALFLRDRTILQGERKKPVVVDEEMPTIREEKSRRSAETPQLISGRSSNITTSSSKKTTKRKKKRRGKQPGSSRTTTRSSTSAAEEEEEPRTRSTQPTTTQLTPTSRKVPTMQSGQRKVEEIKKMIAEMNAREQSRLQQQKKAAAETTSTDSSS